MDLEAFTDASPGTLVPIKGTDVRHGEWVHSAFIPNPLTVESPRLSGRTYRVVADARAALAALDSTARQLPNPRLFRRPSLQAEAQSTSALEGTYAPLSEVLKADEERPPNVDLREIFNYVAMADNAFRWVEDGRPLTVAMLSELQAILVKRTRNESASSGKVRDHQVVIGQRKEAPPGELPVKAARFIPSPPGLDLQASLQDLLAWMDNDEVRVEIDPVVAAGMAHYQFESLHPFNDGNGRIGRLLIVIHLLRQRVLFEPTLTVSPWFEARRTDYYDNLFRVSTEGDWDSYIEFFARGLEASARRTQGRMTSLVEIQASMKEKVRQSKLRADTAHALVDFAVANISFTIRSVERGLGVSYGRANTVVNQLLQLGLLDTLEDRPGTARRFFAPEVYEVLLGEEA
ncbi:Fic family protein [Pseudonocardia sp. DR1-2]|uniref:Fic family protein n=1 Tax=Pseudonocardia sp. DR1-2 TaxID=2951168 RepID=UPI002043739E|nr:Fic family protein [Pseudonocardia sp. DR1-2]MCM3848600.1 Fic family protein [Pseudonocardia sp. DR1-2]